MYRVFITVIIISIVQPKELSNVFHYSSDSCFNGSTVLSNVDNSYELYSKTSDCSIHHNEYQKSSQISSRLCPSGFANLELSPVFHPAVGVYAQNARINITLKIHDKVDAAFIRLECLNAQTGEDVYCSDSPDMFHNNVHTWPCRGVRFNASEVAFPAVFTYKCFRLFPHSTTAINVTIYPQNCNIRTVLTAPQLRKMFPEEWVDAVYINKAQNLNHPTSWLPPMAWSPMVVVDLSESDGIWIKIAKPEMLICKQIDIHLMEKINDTIYSKKNLKINCNDNKIIGVKWFDVKKGHYYLTAFVPFGNCVQKCEKGIDNCNVCPHTELEFRVDEDHVSLMWKLGTKISGIPIFVTFILLILMFFALAGIVACCFLPDHRDRGPPVHIPLREVKKLLLIYAEDSAPHKATVETFRDCLRQNAQTLATINDDMLLEQNCQPSRWINHVYSIMQNHLIILSPLATKIIENSGSEDEGKFEVKQVQPYPDMFKTAFDKVLRECSLSSSVARSMIGVIVLPYSGPIPRKLSILGLPTFNIPEDFTKLTAFIHLIDIRGRNVISNLTPEMKFVLEKRIEATDRDMEARPGWIDERWIAVEKSIEMIVPVATPRRTYNTDKDRIEASEQFGLLPPDLSDDDEKVEDREEEEEDEEQKTVVLRDEKRQEEKEEVKEVQKFELYEPDQDDDDDDGDETKNAESKKLIENEAETGV